MDLTAPRVMCIGTHHKTGTLWMRQVFTALAQAIGVPIHGAFGKSALKHIAKEARLFLTNWSSVFAPQIMARADARIVHVIRDPRDVLLSGMHYHLIAPKGGEEFLHEPRADLGGVTYQTHLNMLQSTSERLLFEMENKHRITVEQMCDWDYTRPNTIELRYEDLMGDLDSARFSEALRDLGLPEPEVEKGAQIFWDHSLFGGLAKVENRSDRVKLHVASGKIEQWRTGLPRDVAARYASRFGDALVRLGYETHPTRWVEEVRYAH